MRSGLDIFGLGPLDSLCRVLPDFLLHEPLAMPQAGLAHQLGAVGPLDPHVFLFILINLAMHKTVGGPASGPLFCQLILCPFQLFPALLHAELGRGGLLLFAFLPEL